MRPLIINIVDTCALNDILNRGWEYEGKCEKFLRVQNRIRLLFQRTHHDTASTKALTVFDD